MVYLGFGLQRVNTYHRASKVMPFEMPLTSKQIERIGRCQSGGFVAALLVRVIIEVGHVWDSKRTPSAKRQWQARQSKRKCSWFHHLSPRVWLSYETSM